MTPARIAGGAVLAAAVIGLAGWGLAPRTPAEDPAPASHTEPARTFWAAYHDATARRTARDLEGAVASYRHALRLRPDHEDSLYYLGNCQLERREYGEALATYERLVAVNPEGSSRGYMQSALVRASLDPGAPRDLDEAERLFTRALRVDPESGAVLGLAEVAILQGDPERARTWLDRAAVEHPASMAVPYLRGYLALRRGDRLDAWRLFQTAVARGEVTKAAVARSEEGDVKADPALRWQALARQSVFGAEWLRLRRYLEQPGPSPVDMERDYSLLEAAITRAVAPGSVTAATRASG
jgi:tetratricopeptide (TPR) repeat protein